MTTYSSVPLTLRHRQLLAEAVDHLDAGSPDSARKCLELLAENLDLERTSDQLAYLLSAGLARRMAGPEQETQLDGQAFDLPQQVGLDLLKSKDPLLLSAYPIANEQLIGLIGGHEAVTLLDLGTGDGSQLVELFGELARRGELPARLTVIAVDVWKDGLDLAQRRLLLAAANRGCKLIFHRRVGRVEELAESDWDLITQADDRLVVNANFTLHHIRHTRWRPDARDTLFARLYALHPVGMVISEPCADFNVFGLRDRLRQAARFYGAIFEHLDQQNLSLDEKRSLKFAWGRELLETVGSSEITESLETPHSWLSRLRRAGFVPATNLDNIPSLFSRPTLRTTANEGYVGLGAGCESLVSVIVVYAGDEVLAPAPPARAPGITQTALAQERDSLHIIRYLTTLVSVARANGSVHVRQRDFVNGQALLAGIDPAALWNAPGDPRQAAFLAPRSTRDAVLRDCIALACIDGGYDPKERSRVHGLAGSFGVNPERIAELEVAAQCPPPSLAPDGLAWLRDRWMVPSKAG